MSQREIHSRAFGWFPGVLLLALLGATICGCASNAGKPSASTAPADHKLQGQGGALTTQAGVEEALNQARQAFIKGDWGTAVVACNQVMEGAATPEQYYAAVKILGMASCNRKDSGPVEFAWPRLSPADREGLKNQCAQQGLSINEAGEVEAF